MKVPPDIYFKMDLYQRMELLNTPSVDHFCKCVVFENTHFKPEFESPYYQRYIIAFKQYAKPAVNGEKCKSVMSRY